MRSRESSARSASCIERRAIEHDAHVADSSVADLHILRTRGVLNWNGVRPVHDQRRGVVAESADQFRMSDDLAERPHERSEGLGAIDAARGRVADDVIGDVAHRLLEVMTAPRAVVAERDPKSDGYCLVVSHLRPLSFTRLTSDALVVPVPNAERSDRREAGSERGVETGAALV